MADSALDYACRQTEESLQIEVNLLRQEMRDLMYWVSTPSSRRWNSGRWWKIIRTRDWPYIKPFASDNVRGIEAIFSRFNPE